MAHHLIRSVSGPFRTRLLVYGALGVLALGAGGAQAGFHELKTTAESYAVEHAIPAAHANAIEHCLGSAILAERYGTSIARFLGNVRESASTKNDPADSFKDQWNNAIGRAIAEHAKKTGADRDRLVLDAYRDGQLIVDEHGDPRVAAGATPAYSAPSAKPGAERKKPSPFPSPMVI